MIDFTRFTRLWSSSQLVLHSTRNIMRLKRWHDEVHHTSCSCLLKCAGASIRQLCMYRVSSPVLVSVVSRRCIGRSFHRHPRLPADLPGCSLMTLVVCLNGHHLACSWQSLIYGRLLTPPFCCLSMHSTLFITTDVFKFLPLVPIQRRNGQAKRARTLFIHCHESTPMP